MNFSILDRMRLLLVISIRILWGTSMPVGLWIAKQFEAGLMERALRTTTNLFFRSSDSIGLWLLPPHNQRSGSLLDKLGFKRKGLPRNI